MKTILSKRTMRTALWTLLLLPALMVACGDDEPENLDKLALERSELILMVGEEATVRITSGNGAYTIVSDDTAVATAEISGDVVKISALSDGTTEIKVTDTRSKETASVKVTVEQDDPQIRLELSRGEVEMEEGDVIEVNIVSGSGDYSLEVDNDDVASADEQGNVIKITALSGGEATLVVTDSETGQTATVEISVVPLPFITFTTDYTWGDLRILIDAKPEHRAKVWIDLNEDGIRQENEAVTFGEITEYAFNEKVTIYGRVNHLECSSLSITELDLSHNPYLERLACGGNSHLMALDFTENTELVWLDCSNLGKVTNDVDFSKNTKLEYLNCSNVGFHVLDVSNNHELEELVCIMSQVREVRLGSISKIQRMNMWNNWFERIDLSNLSELVEANFAGNEIVEIDVTKNTKLQNLNLTGNHISSIDLSKCTELVSCRVGGSGFANADFINDLPNPAKIKVMDVRGILTNTSLDLSPFVNVMEVHCEQSSIQGEEMTRTLTSLPARAAGDDAIIYVIDRSPMSPGENNVATVSQVKIATDKNWKVYNLNTGGSPFPYSGSED